MNRADIDSLIGWMYWANWKLLDAAEKLSTDEFLAPSTVTTRDLRATLVHELDVEWSWRLNLLGLLTDATEELRPTDYPDVGAIREHWRRDEADMHAWLESLTDADILAEVPSELSKDRRPLWQYLLHIVTHAAQQQADAATLLSLAGRSPGELGYLEYIMRLRSGV
jgi:uncharacterized damage-inducible protein DinB